MTETRTQFTARKLKSAFLALLISSIVWSVVTIYTDEEIVYHLAEHFYGMAGVYFFYAGVVVLIYGNLVSILTESVLRRWSGRTDWLYVPILGGAGTAIGLLFPFTIFIILGILTAVFYGMADRWFLYRSRRGKGSTAIFAAPLVAFLILWCFFYFTSPPLPPVTAEDAVEFATGDSDTKLDDFPNEVGTWKGMVDGGYLVERITAVEPLEENIYLVTFTETWQKGEERGTWLTSYRVDRSSSTVYEEEGNLPPYDVTNSIYHWPNGRTEHAD